jgi:hypothetical protein
MTSAPKGMRTIGISLNAWMPNGIPMIVMHRITPPMRQFTASHKPPKMIQRMLPMMRSGLATRSVYSTCRPNGHSANPASLNAWMPNGMVMMRMNITIPATTKPMASQIPTKMSHRMLPSVCTVSLPPLPTGRSSQ